MIRWMRALVRFLGFLIVLAVIVAAGAWFWAGRSEGPSIEIRQPGQFVGQGTTLDVMIASPDGRFSAVAVVVEQNGREFPVFTQEAQAPSATPDPAQRIYVMRPIGKQAIPELQSGPARIVVRAARPVLYGLRQVESTATRDVQVRLEPPRVAVLSTFHFINHGGSEFVVYRATPDDVASGVRVGDKEYPGYPARGAGITADPALRVAFFALLYDQTHERPDSGVRPRRGRQRSRGAARPPGASRSRTGRAASRSTTASCSASCRRSPATSPDGGHPDRRCAGRIPQDQRRPAAEEQPVPGATWRRRASPEMLFKDAFQQLGNSQVEAEFADTRTYVYKGKDVDQQVHLGFDLAVTANVPIVAAQRGIVVHAGDLGIYGNCVVIDHGTRRAVALRPPVVDRGQGGRHGGQGAADRPQRHDRAGRRRPPALHDAGRRAAGHARWTGGARSGCRTGCCARSPRPAA